MSVVRLRRIPLILTSCVTSMILLACGGGGSTPPTTTIPTPAANKAPTANAGADQTANELTVVTLVGSGTDSDGTIAIYSWVQTSTGTSITLTDSTLANATFTAPDIAADETITFELTVTDNDNATHKDTVDITITHIEPEPPVDPEPPVTPTEPVTDIPEGGTLVITNNPVSNAGFWNGSDSENAPVGTTNVVDVEHEDFSQALEVDITNPSGVSWRGQVSIPVTQELKLDDNILLHLYFRTIESQYETGTGFTTVLLQGPAESDYYKIISRNISSSSDWVEYFIAAKVGRGFPANDLNILFELGAGDKPQKFQLAGIELLNYQQTLTLDDLPNTKLSYDGRAADAPWRAEAQARIEQHRKGDFTVTLQNADGEIIPNTDVNLTMTKHAYHFGSAISVPQLVEESNNGDIYREKVLELFNQAGPENALKWPAWLGEYGGSFSQSNTQQALEWLNEHEFYTRGHVLIWPSKRNMPNAMQGYLPDDAANADPQILTEVKNHIDDVASKTAHLLQEWDVLNEPFDNHYLMDAFGDQVMLDWFEQARTNLPTHKLYINDYGILSGGGLNIEHQEHYKKTIQYLIDESAEINGIGLQSHFSEVLTPISKVWEILDSIHQIAPELVIRSTEFDVTTKDEQLQADYTRDFITLFFSHPATVGVQLWGFWENRHWFPDAAMYRSDWSEKPNAVVWKDLIFNQWNSQFTGQTNDLGQFSERAFYGEYEAKFTHDGVEKSLHFSILKGEQNNITLKLAE
ncbi:endo-1,4-beta-xylanase [Paraglaciecola aquimarina]|uniref:Beta-xylanase n=1 Tax=Paraglaciecola algarum TaxID=3050085 RepID=A0ABS9D2H0_9ALTE|nr:endo-1,4-beta-xylanase [Paraglaciecola sp. G1-23]MCF2947103.1 endo-1,4-beta-xylanase [Paraglaciecola sp. G1-23]